MQEVKNPYLMEFYNECLKAADLQPYRLKDEEAIICTLQAFRYTLKEFLSEHGEEITLRMINSGRYYF